MEETKQDINQYKFNDIIVNQNQLSLSLCEFFGVVGFDPNQFFDSSFWYALNVLDDEEWFEVTDDIIERIGYKGTSSRTDHIRSNLIRFIKKQFVENIDYILANQNGGGKSKNVVHNKLTLKMKRDSFKMVLMKANTQYSDQIYRYLITFENHVKQYAIYQRECESHNAKQKLAVLEAKTAVPMISPMLHNRIKTERTQRQIYVMTSKKYARMNVYKIGMSYNAKKRKCDFNASHVLNDDVFDLVHTVSCYDTDLCEKLIHSQLNDYRYKEARVGGTEFVMCPIDTIIRVVDHIARMVNESNAMIEETTNGLFTIEPSETETEHSQSPLLLAETEAVVSEKRTDNIDPEFQNLHLFLEKHRDVGIDELLAHYRAIRYYKRLRTKPVKEEITNANYSQLCMWALDMEVQGYEEMEPAVLARAILDRFNDVFTL